MAKTLLPVQGAWAQSLFWGTRSHVPQLRVFRPQLKIPHATVKIKVLSAAAEIDAVKLID